MKKASVCLVVGMFLLPFFLDCNSCFAIVFDYPVERSLYLPGSYAGRYFYCCSEGHLGDDIDLAEGTEVRAIGDGELIYYKTDGSAPNGFGDLYAITRHDLGQEYDFVNAHGDVVTSRYVCFFYGHIRNTPDFHGDPNTALPWPRNYLKPKENHPDLPVPISRGDIVGYIERSSHPDNQAVDPNGDGLEHGHFGSQLSFFPQPPFGYENSTEVGATFTNPGLLIERFLGVVGFVADGNFYQPIVNAYNRVGSQAFGSPQARVAGGVSRPNTVFDWSLCKVQLFNSGSLGPCAIIHDLVYQARSGGATLAYPMHGMLWQYYESHGGPELLLPGSIYIGGPIGYEYTATHNNGHSVVVQKLANGYLVFDAVAGQIWAQETDSGLVAQVQTPTKTPTPIITKTPTPGSGTPQSNVLPGQYPGGYTFSSPIVARHSNQGSGVPYDNGNGRYVYKAWSDDGLKSVTLQDFFGLVNGQQQLFHIVEDAAGSAAYVMHGEIAQTYFQDFDGVGELGPPVGEVQYGYAYYPYSGGGFQTNQPMISWDRQVFENGDSLMWHAGLSQAIRFSPTGGGVIIAIIPGNGTTLTIEGWHLSDTQVYLTCNPITGAAHYDVHRNGGWIGEMSNFEFTDSGLTPQTSYQYKVIALDGNNNVLTQSSTITITTPATPGPTVAIVDLQYFMQSNRIEFSIPDYTGATYARLYIDGAMYQTAVNSFYLSPYLDNGTYTVYVELYNNLGQVIAKSLSKQVQLGGGIVTQVVSGPTIVGPSESHELKFLVTNTSGYTIGNWRVCVAESVTPNWMSVDQSAMKQLPYLSPGQTTFITIPFTTKSNYLFLGETAIGILAEGDCGSCGGVVRNISYVHPMALVPVVDYRLKFGAISNATEGELTIIAGSVENGGNTPAPSCDLDIMVDGVVATSVVIPTIAARAYWNFVLPLGYLTAGTHVVRGVVDPNGAVAEAEKFSFDVTKREVLDRFRTNLPAIKDYSISKTSSDPCGNAYQWTWKSDPRLRVTNNNSPFIGSHRALLEFGLPSLPAPVEITGATMWLYLLTQNDFYGGDFEVDRSLMRFDAGSTWCNSGNSGPWNGGSYTQENACVLRILNPHGNYTSSNLGWYRWNVRAMVMDWYGGKPNNGMVLRSLLTEPNQFEYLDFASSRHSNQQLHPFLEISAEHYQDTTTTYVGNNIASVTVTVAMPSGPTPTPTSTPVPSATPTPTPTPALPDIAVELTLNGQPVKGVPYTLRAKISNGGLGVASGFQVAIKVGGETNPPLQSCPGLAGAQTWTASRTVTFGQCMNYAVTVVADWDSEVLEVDETNNTLMQVVSVLCVTPTPTPTLTPTNTPLPSATPTPTQSPTPSSTATPTRSPTPMPSATPATVQAPTGFVDESNSSIVADPGWTSVPVLNAYGGSAYTCTTAKKSLWITCSGRLIKLWFMAGPNCGVVAVKANGEWYLRDLYRSTPQAVCYQFGNLPLKTQTVRVMTEGTKNASSTGYAVNFDGYVISQ